MSKRNNAILVLLFSSIAMVCLILDRQTALQGATDGIRICINTIIPTLLPYIFISTLLCSSLQGRKIPVIRRLGRFCCVPDGAEAILLLGLLGGYPVGAKLIGDCYHYGQLKPKTANRMLGFCNNAGPSFLFGILGSIFHNHYIPAILWIVHILSAMTVGIILPNREPSSCRISTTRTLSISNTLLQSLKTIAYICGWVILFRIFLSFCESWFLQKIPITVTVLITGLCELANGCIILGRIPSEFVQILVCSCLLAFGGVCVLMQTKSVIHDLSIGAYLKGKLLQTLLSISMVIPICWLLYTEARSAWIVLLECALLGILGVLIVVFKSFAKKDVAIIA